MSNINVVNNETITGLYGVVNYDLLEAFDLKANEALFLNIVYNLQKAKNWCYASQKYFADLMKVHTRTIQRYTKKLIELDLLDLKHNQYKGGTNKLRVTDVLAEALEMAKNGNETKCRTPHDNLSDNSISHISLENSHSSEVEDFKDLEAINLEYLNNYDFSKDAEVIKIAKEKGIADIGEIYSKFANYYKADKEMLNLKIIDWKYYFYNWLKKERPQQVQTPDTSPKKTYTAQTETKPTNTSTEQDKSPYKQKMTFLNWKNEMVEKFLGKDFCKPVADLGGGCYYSGNTVIGINADGFLCFNDYVLERKNAFIVWKWAFENQDKVGMVEPDEKDKVRRFIDLEFDINQTNAFGIVMSNRYVIVDLVPKDGEFELIYSSIHDLSKTTTSPFLFSVKKLEDLIAVGGTAVTKN